MPDKIVVIGSNSFSGASFIKYALEQGNEVLGISRAQENPRYFLPYKHITTEKFQFKQFDLNKDTDEIVSQIVRFNANYVVNFAAQSMVAESWQNPEHWYETNVVANVKLFEELRKLTSLLKYVHISTPEVYGSCSGIVDETCSYSPSTPYATSRAACDMHLFSMFKNYDFPVVFTRAANVFGSFQQLYRIIPRTILYIRLGKKLKLHGGGKSLRSFIHIRDVAKATLSIMEKASPPEIFHLSTDQHISIRDLVELICDKMNENFESFVEVCPDRPGKDSAYLLDSSKAKSYFNWQPSVTLEDGIKETIDWIDKYFNDLKLEKLNYIHRQ